METRAPFLELISFSHSLPRLKEIFFGKLLLMGLSQAPVLSAPPSKRTNQLWIVFPKDRKKNNNQVFVPPERPRPQRHKRKIRNRNNKSQEIIWEDETNCWPLVTLDQWKDESKRCYEKSIVFWMVNRFMDLCKCMREETDASMERNNKRRSVCGEVLNAWKPTIWFLLLWFS